MKTTVLLLALGTAVSLSAQAATLKPFSTLTGATVRLSDIWDGVTNDRALGPAPAPGGRITVPAAQLAAIARDFGVDWRMNSTTERVILERPGRTLTREDVKPALLAALAKAGIASDAEIEIGAIAADPVPAEAKLDITVTQFDLDPASGRFNAVLAAAITDSPDTSFRVSGHAQEMMDVPTFRRRIPIGEIVTARDLDWTRVRANLSRGEIVRTMANAIGLAAKRTIQPNQPILAADLGRAMVILKGEGVTLSLESAGLAVTARGLAIEPGGLNDHIRVLNEAARATVEAEITGPGQARVIPGTARPAPRYLAAR